MMNRELYCGESERRRPRNKRTTQEAADKKARAEQRAANSRKQQTQTPPAENPPSKEPSEPPANPAPSPDYYAATHGSASDETAGSDLPKPREETSTGDRLPTRDPEAPSKLIIAELDVPARWKLELLVEYGIEETKRMRAEQASATAGN